MSREGLAKFLSALKFPGHTEMGSKYFTNKNPENPNETVIIFYPQFCKTLTDLILEKFGNNKNED